MKRAPLLTSHARGAAAAALLAISALSIAGCASTPTTRWHSLMPTEASAATASVPAPGPWLSLEDVRVPAAVDAPQWLVQHPDGSLLRLEQERWASPLRDELRAALMHRWTTHWHARDARWLSGPLAGQAWRVQVDVARFDLRPGRSAELEAVWAVQAPNGGSLACRTRLSHNAATGDMPALAAAQRAALQQIADQLGQAVTSAAAGSSPLACPSGGHTG